jgi:hypothetical protein
MDRHINFIAQLFQDLDVLYTNLHPYIGISKLAAGLLGTSTQLNGLACTQTATPSMSVLIAPGEIYALEEIDTSDYGSLSTNTTQILKQGIQLNAITTPIFTAPSTSGDSQNFLIEFAFQEQDGGSKVLPYYNPANPPVPFQGPGGDGASQNTVRLDQVIYQIKAGTPATTGSQTTPTPDAGYVGGWVVTIAEGQTTIINADIAEYPSAPFIVNNSIQSILQPILQTNEYLYAADSSVSANTVTASLTPVPIAYLTGMSIFISIANTNTGASTININSLGSKNIVYSNGNALVGGELYAGQIAELVFNGTSFELRNPANLSLIQIYNINPIILTSTSSSTYTPSSNVQFIRVKMVGGGGGSGYVKGTSNGYGVSTGGTSGGYLEFMMTAAEIGSSLSYQCGGGGSGGVSPSTGANNGTATTFGNWTAAAGGHGTSVNATASTNVKSTANSGTFINTVGTGIPLLNITQSYASYGVALTIPLGIVSLGGNSPFIGNTGSILTSTITSGGSVASVAGASYGCGASGALTLDVNTTLNGSAGGNGVIYVYEYI